MKYNNFLNLWLEKYVKHSVKNSTFNIYEKLINLHIKDNIGDIDLKKLSLNTLQNFFSDLLEHGNLVTGNGLSVNSVNLIATIIKESLHMACSLEFIKKNPADGLKLPPVFQKEINVFEPNEQRKLEYFCLHSKKSNHLGIVICLYTGLRIGELLALSWNDIDFKNGFLTISKTVSNNIINSPKTKSSNRIVPLSKSLLDLLKKSRKNSNSKYVISTRDGERVKIRSYQKTFKSILNKLNIPNRNFHSLRHTFATRALEFGIDVKTVSEILGHKNPTITLKRYAHSPLSYKIQIMNKFGKSLNF